MCVCVSVCVCVCGSALAGVCGFTPELDGEKESQKVFAELIYVFWLWGSSHFFLSLFPLKTVDFLQLKYLLLSNSGTKNTAHYRLDLNPYLYRLVPLLRTGQPNMALKSDYHN